MSKWYHPSSSKNIPTVPWLGSVVIEKLEKIIKKDFSILEHGSGGSTLWLAERANLVMSFENNISWYRSLKEKIPDNVKLIYNNWSPGIADNWREYFPFDLLLIDGEPVTERNDWIVESKIMVKHGGYVVLDNANRPEYKVERDYLHMISEEVEIIDSNENTSFLVTDICRLK